MNRLKSICVLGGSSPGTDEDFKKTAVELGKVLAERKINVVYGGGVHGLKGCVAGSAFLGGSHILGILFKHTINHNFSNLTLGTEVRVSSMHERFGHMFYNSEAFVALPGGLETLEGIACMLFCTKFNCHRKPLGLLNINGFYDSLLSFLDQAVEQRFIPQATRQAILSASTADQLINQLQSWVSGPDTNVIQVDSQSEGSSKDRELDTELCL